MPEVQDRLAAESVGEWAPRQMSGGETEEEVGDDPSGVGRTLAQVERVADLVECREHQVDGDRGQRHDRRDHGQEVTATQREVVVGGRRRRR